MRAVRGTHSSAQNFIDNYNRTVTDTQNGLMWELKTTDNMNYTYNWQEALSYCENLTLLGYADWRLPNINELQSVVDYERFDPAIKPFFPNTLPFEYWSSTSEVQNGGDGALYVHFSRGNVIDSNTSNVNGKSYLYFVRAVRNVGDYDQDQIGDMEDNCPTVSNAFQYDIDTDGVGDACDVCPYYPSPNQGDFDCDQDCDGSDAALFKSDFGRSSFNNRCPRCAEGEWCSYTEL